MAVLRTQLEARDAPRSDLAETHLALTGQVLSADVSDAAARVQVTMAMLSAINQTAHIGVPKEWSPKVLTLTERGVLMSKKYPEGTLAADLDNKVAAKPARKPKADKADKKGAPKTPRLRLSRVAATTTGTSKLQANSDRYAVFTHVQAAGPEGITVEALDQATGLSTRSYLQKLLEKGHIVVLETADEQAA